METIKQAIQDGMKAGGHIHEYAIEKLSAQVTRQAEVLAAHYSDDDMVRYVAFLRTKAADVSVTLDTIAVVAAMAMEAEKQQALDAITLKLRELAMPSTLADAPATIVNEAPATTDTTTATEGTT